MRASGETHPPPLPPSEQVRQLAEAGRIDEARRLVEQHRGTGDPNLEGWARLLGFPRVTTAARGARGDFAADHAWLRGHREAYRGRWVALRDGALLDSDVTLRPLVDRLTESGLVEGAFVVQVA